MSDTSLNKIIQYGTAIERAAFVPAPAAGSQIIYIWYETDTGDTYLYDTAWHKIANASSTVGVTTTGTVNTGGFTGFSGPSSITSVTPGGDVVGATNSTTLSLATTGVTAGTYGAATIIPILTIDTKGRITTAATVTNPAVSAITSTGTVNTGGLTKWASNTQITGAQLSGDGTTGTTDATLVLATTGVTAGAYGSATIIPVITVDAKGRLTTVTTVTNPGAAAITSTAPVTTGGITKWSSGTQISSGQLSGDVTTGTADLVAALSTTGVGAGTYGAGTIIPIITVDAKGRLTTVTTASNPGALGTTGQSFTFGVTIGDGSNLITTGIKGYSRLPVTGTIQRWTLISIDAGAPLTGNIQVDIYKDVFANFPPTSADSIVGTTNQPKLTAASVTTSTTLTGWTTSFTSGDFVAFSVTTVTTLTRVLLQVDALTA